MFLPDIHLSNPLPTNGELFRQEQVKTTGVIERNDDSHAHFLLRLADIVLEIPRHEWRLVSFPRKSQHYLVTNQTIQLTRDITPCRLPESFKVYATVSPDGKFSNKRKQISFPTRNCRPQLPYRLIALKRNSVSPSVVHSFHRLYSIPHSSLNFSDPCSFAHHKCARTLHPDRTSVSFFPCA